MSESNYLFSFFKKTALAKNETNGWFFKFGSYVVLEDGVFKESVSCILALNLLSGVALEAAVLGFVFIPPLVF